MQIFENNDKIFSIYQLATSLSIHKDFAHQQDGQYGMAGEQGSEQEYRRRELLSVELETQREKIIAEHGKTHFKNQVMNNFFAEVLSEVNTELDNKENTYAKILKIEDAAPKILEKMSLRAASINQIKPFTKTLNWLSSDLLKLVNKPQYRKHSDVQVTDAQLALSFIGLDNLKLVLPTFILKHWLPTSTTPFPLMKRRLWGDCLATALASSTLAEAYDLDAYTAFTAGMLSNIGLLAVTRCFLTIYNDMLTEKKNKAYEDKDKRLYEVLLNIGKSPELLLEQILTRSTKLSAELVELMSFERLNVTEAIFDLAYNDKIEKMHPIAQIVAKSRAYIMFRNLDKAELINEHDAQALFDSVNLTDTDIALLKKKDIDHIKLIFN